MSTLEKFTDRMDLHLPETLATRPPGALPVNHFSTRLMGEMEAVYLAIESGQSGEVIAAHAARLANCAMLLAELYLDRDTN